MMKRIILLVLCAMISIGIQTVSAQDAAADKIVGNYAATQNGVKSKVKIFKHADGYRAQVYWVNNLTKPDGTVRTDEKNSNPAKRSVQADKIVLIEKVTYEAKDNCWKNGKVYDPTSGKTYKVEITFKDAKTLCLKGMLGPFSKKVYWTKL